MPNIKGSHVNFCNTVVKRLVLNVHIKPIKDSPRLWTTDVLTSQITFWIKPFYLYRATFNTTQEIKRERQIIVSRVVSRFLSSRFHPKSRWLFPFYISNIKLRTDLLTFGVTGAVFKIAGEMRLLPGYFDNPVWDKSLKVKSQNGGCRATRYIFLVIRRWKQVAGDWMLLEHSLDIDSKF